MLEQTVEAALILLNFTNSERYHRFGNQHSGFPTTAAMSDLNANYLINETQ